MARSFDAIVVGTGQSGPSLAVRMAKEGLRTAVILVDATTRQILGATIFGIEGDEVVHTVLATMYAKAPYSAIQRGMYIHPTVSELVPTLLGGLAPLAS